MTPPRKKKADDAPPNPTLDFETHLERIEAEVEKLEGGELSLEDSLKAYEAALASLKSCHTMLEAAEGRIRILTSPEGEPPRAATYNGHSGHAEDDEEELSDGQSSFDAS